MLPEKLYDGREQTLIKHLILRKYLEGFAYKIASRWSTITYIDCFSGPWNVRSDDLKDSSFSIAVEELRKARAAYEQKGRSIRLRCMFLEKDPNAYEKLKVFAEQNSDIEIKTKKSELKGSIDEVLQFICAGGPNAFPFIFIDPTGWTGFGMDLIAPLLKIKPGEVFINFMTDYIRRFFDLKAPEFANLFGPIELNPSLALLWEECQEKYLGKVMGIDTRTTTEQDREDLLVEAYAQNVKRIGGFDHSCVAVILYPDNDRSYFHLLYATRSRRGIEVFKGVEKQAMAVMEEVRQVAKERKRFKRTQQPSLFSAEFMPHSRPIDTLRKRYLRKARECVLEKLQIKPRLLYEEVWDLAMGFPLVWESDLKDWIKAWKAAEQLRIDGMKAGQRVPKIEQGNILFWEQK